MPEVKGPKKWQTLLLRGATHLGQKEIKKKRGEGTSGGGKGFGLAFDKQSNRTERKTRV